MSLPRKLNIIYSDEDIVVVNKSSGTLSIPDRYDASIESLSVLLKNRFNSVFTVHRLDKETSGAIVFALNADSHRHLNTQFQDNKVEKIYHAVVAGIMDKDGIDVDIPLMPHPAKPGVMLPSARGKESLTKIKVIERYRHATLLECNLVTGRQHQLRVHCATIGYPLLVDRIYGNTDKFYLSAIKRKFNLKKSTDEHPVISRVTMHAYSLTFIHPVKNEKVSFTADYPKDFSALIQIFNKYSSTALVHIKG